MSTPTKLKVTYVKVSDLMPYARNARLHSDEQVDALVASIKEFGWTSPILLDGAKGILAGHGRVLAAQKLKLKSVPCIELGWMTEEQKKAYVIADNRLPELASWDKDILATEFKALDLAQFDMGLVGFDDDDIKSIIARVVHDDQQSTPSQSDAGGAGGQDGNEGGTGKSDGSLLALVNVAVADPTHKVEAGDVWRVGKHVLLCCSVMTDHEQWVPHLQQEGAVFCPYPGPFVPLGNKAQDHVLVMVQPDLYAAGHLLDRYTETHGEGSCTKVVAQ